MSEETTKKSTMNRAKPYQLVLFPFNTGATNVYYILTITYIAYYLSLIHIYWGQLCASGPLSARPVFL